MTKCPERRRYPSRRDCCVLPESRFDARAIKAGEACLLQMPDYLFAVGRSFPQAAESQ
jgi:hypothetical protein